MPKILHIAGTMGSGKTTLIRAWMAQSGVVARRLAQGNFEPLPSRFEDGLKGNNVRAENYAFKMKQAGAPVIKITRADGLERINEVLSQESVAS
jgi:hypothetical protein